MVPVVGKGSVPQMYWKGLHLPMSPYQRKRREPGGLAASITWLDPILHLNTEMARLVASLTLAIADCMEDCLDTTN